MALNFAATVAGTAHRHRALSRPRGRRARLTGRGFITLDASRAFDVTADATHFDPSRFGAFPAGSLDGSDHGARTAGAAMERRNRHRAGAGQPARKASRSAATCMRKRRAKTMRNVAAKVAVASATIAVSGAAGTSGDKLAFNVDAAEAGRFARRAGESRRRRDPRDNRRRAARSRNADQRARRQRTRCRRPRRRGLQWGKLVRVATLEATCRRSRPAA